MRPVIAFLLAILYVVLTIGLAASNPVALISILLAGVVTELALVCVYLSSLASSSLRQVELLDEARLRLSLMDQRLFRIEDLGRRMVHQQVFPVEGPPAQTEPLPR